MIQLYNIGIINTFRRCSSVFLLILFPMVLLAQIEVKSFRKLETDPDARLNESKKDQNGDLCAIIKIPTTEKGFSFDIGQLAIQKVEYKTAEVWVYIPYGTKRITISHPQLGQKRDYPFEIPIEKATVYLMEIFIGKKNIIIEETIQNQWLVITTNPPDAAIYVNDQYAGSGEYQVKQKRGFYTYRVEAPMHHKEAGKVEIRDTTRILNIVLKPAFGYLSVTSVPEEGAKVLIDGISQAGTTPFISDRLASGEHTVQVLREMYQPASQKVVISDTKTSEVKLEMKPNFAELNITAPQEATFYINNEVRSTGPWKGRLTSGIYSVEVRQDKHRSAKKDIEIIAGKNLSIDMLPTPIYGSLDVITTPIGASISINGKTYGTTPYTIQKLLIGDYSVTLSKDGYGTIVKSIIINENKTASINESLSNAMHVRIESEPAGAEIYIDGGSYGKTPVELTLAYGNHRLKLVNGRKTVEENINLTAGGKSTFNYNVKEEPLMYTLTINSGDYPAQVFSGGKNLGSTGQAIRMPAGQSSSISIKSFSAITLRKTVNMDMDKTLNVSLYPKSSVFIGAEAQYDLMYKCIGYGGNLGLSFNHFFIGIGGGVQIPKQDEFNIDVTHQNISVSSTKYSLAGQSYVQDSKGYFFYGRSGFFTYKPFKMFLTAGYGYLIGPEFQHVYEAGEAMYSGLYIPLNTGDYFTKPETSHYNSSYFITGLSLPVFDKNSLIGLDVWWGADGENIVSVNFMIPIGMLGSSSK
jgi:hypothetical protein